MRRQLSVRKTKPGTIRRRAFGRTLLCDDDLPGELIDELWQGDVERMVFSSAPLQVKDRCIAARLKHATGTFIVKRHTWGGLGRTLRSAWRTSAARGSLRLSRRLADLGIPTPRPRACLEELFGLVGYRSYLLTDYVEGHTLYHCLRHHTHSTDELKDLARQVVAIWEQLVALEISHNDMKPENFIVDPSNRVWLIDLERVRFHRHRGRMKRRQLADVSTFLHPRAWRNQWDARQVFQDAFFDSTRGDWTKKSEVDRGTAAPSNSEAERLSVVILCDDSQAGPAELEPTIAAAQEFADEIVLVAARGGRSEVLRRIQVGRCGGDDIADSLKLGGPPAARLARFPWVLLLHANERVTPLLTLDVEECLAKPAAFDAYRIPVDQFVFGDCASLERRKENAPIRLFHQHRCSFSVSSGGLAISTEPERTGQLGGAIQQRLYPDVPAYMDAAGAESTRAASERFERGERARLGRSTLRSMMHFVASFTVRGGYQHGWAGFQSSALSAFNIWLQDVKLWQMTHQFWARPRHSVDSEREIDDVQVVVSRRLSDSEQFARAKAA